MSEDIAAPPETADPAALSLALTGASRNEADAFLRDQRHHLHEQLKQIHLDIFEKWLGVLLRVATLMVGLGLATALAIGLWAAGRAEGTVVDAFSVPPQFTQAGMSGEVIADDFTNRLDTVRDIAVGNSLSSSHDVRKDSSDDIRVEIPETGVSLGQAWRYLRLWLGHERHLSGSLRTIGQGRVALTVALDGKRAAAVSGLASDLDRLEQQAAEQVFASAEPINYTLYLLGEKRTAEAFTAVQRVAQLANGPVEQANAYSLWANLTRSLDGNEALAVARARLAEKLNPHLMAGHREMMWAFAQMGHDQEALQQAEAIEKFQEKDQPANLQGSGFAEMSMESAFMRNVGRGAFAQAVSDGYCQLCSQTTQSMVKAEFAARAHDGAAVRGLAAEALSTGPMAGVDTRLGLGTDIARVRYFEQVNFGDWPAAAASARAYAAAIRADSVISQRLKDLKLRVQVAPLLASALAYDGDLAGAGVQIDPTPGDCYDCIRVRGVIAAAAAQWRRADGWFARAVHDAPSMPFAYHDWGTSLLARGQPDAAIEKFKLANQKGPHFADPLGGWGEALMAKNQSHLALAKFAEAEKYAPNWGRLHLKWGEALVYAGKPADAKAQFARAAALDLTPSEKTELAKASHD